MKISHGGYHHAFPMFLANCLKHKFDYKIRLKDWTFVDSMLQFKGEGFAESNLRSLCHLIGLPRNICFTSRYNVDYLKDVLMYYPDVVLNYPYKYTLTDIERFLYEKLPIKISTICELATLVETTSSIQLQWLLHKHIKRKTALNSRMLPDIINCFLNKIYIEQIFFHFLIPPSKSSVSYDYRVTT